jgi:hypothetical protein
VAQSYLAFACEFAYIPHILRLTQEVLVENKIFIRSMHELECVDELEIGDFVEKFVQVLES